MLKKDNIKKILQHLPFILIILIIAFLTIDKTCENDLFFDLKTGESILKFGIDFKDHFSLIPNLTYIYHHWLYDLIVYGIFSFGSYVGLLGFFNLCFDILLIYLYKMVYQRTNNRYLSCGLVVVLIFMLNSFDSTRVQLATYPLFLMYFDWINKYYQSANKKYLIGISIISIIILNLHVTMWFLLIVFLLPYLVEMIFSTLVKKYKKLAKFLSNRIVIEPPKDKKKFIILSIIIFLSGLITPLKLWAYKFSFVTLMNKSSFKDISEMMPTNLFSNYKYLILILITVVCYIFVNKKVKFRNVLYIIGLVLLSLLADRNNAYLIMFMPIILLDFLEIKNIKFVNLLDKYEINKEITNYIFSGLLLVLLFIVYFRVDYKVFNYNENIYPVEIVKYLKENYDYKNLKTFTEYNFGSYVEFNDIPSYIDSRAEVYIPDFNNGPNIMQEYQEINSNYLQAEKFIEKYEFDALIVFNGTYLDLCLKKDKNYVEVMRSNMLYGLYVDKNIYISVKQ